MASSFFAGMEAVASSLLSGSSFEPRASRCRSTRMGDKGFASVQRYFFFPSSTTGEEVKFREGK